MDITIAYCDNSSDAKVNGSDVFDFPLFIYYIIEEGPGVCSIDK